MEQAHVHSGSHQGVSSEVEPEVERLKQERAVGELKVGIESSTRANGLHGTKVDAFLAQESKGTPWVGGSPEGGAEGDPCEGRA